MSARQSYGNEKTWGRALSYSSFLQLSSGMEQMTETLQTMAEEEKRLTSCESESLKGYSSLMRKDSIAEQSL